MPLRPSFRTRALVYAALTANAIRPLPGFRVGIPAFFAGWITGELAPHELTGHDDRLVVLAAKRGRKAKKKVLTLGSARFSLAGGKDAKLTIKLSAKARKLLKHGKLRAKLVITVRDAAGNSSTSTKSVGLKAPRKRR